MDCKTASDLMMDALDQRIAPKELQELNKHLAQCCHCRDEYELMQQMVNQLQGLTTIQPPGEDFEARVMAAIDPGLYQRKSAVQQRRKKDSPDWEIGALGLVMGIYSFISETVLRVNLQDVWGWMQQLLSIGQVAVKGFFLKMLLHAFSLRNVVTTQLLDSTIGAKMLYGIVFSLLLGTMFMIYGTLQKLLKGKGESLYE